MFFLPIHDRIRPRARKNKGKIPTEIGTQIKALRLRKGVTQEAIAQAQEICGNDAEAIAALNEEIEVAARDWAITEGEFVDKIRREIARLERARQ